MNVITKILNKKPLSLLGDNVAVFSGKKSVYINGTTGKVSGNKENVSVIIEMPYESWMYVLQDEGSLGSMIVDGLANISGSVSLAFKLSDMIG